MISFINYKRIDSKRKKFCKYSGVNYHLKNAQKVREQVKRTRNREGIKIKKKEKKIPLTRHHSTSRNPATHWSAGLFQPPQTACWRSLRCWRGILGRAWGAGPTSLMWAGPAEKDKADLYPQLWLFSRIKHHIMLRRHSGYNLTGCCVSIRQARRETKSVDFRRIKNNFCNFCGYMLEKLSPEFLFHSCFFYGFKQV